jgi:hypothetical protein
MVGSLARTGPMATGPMATGATAPDREHPAMSIRSLALLRLVTGAVMDRCEAIREPHRGRSTRVRRTLAQQVSEVPASLGPTREAPVSREPTREAPVSSRLTREAPVSTEPTREVIRVAAPFPVRPAAAPVRQSPIRDIMTPALRIPGWPTRA